MNLLHSGTDIAVIALWLGHERLDTTQVYVTADLAMKEKILGKTAFHQSRCGGSGPMTRSWRFSKASDYYVELLTQANPVFLHRRSRNSGIIRNSA